MDSLTSLLFRAVSLEYFSPIEAIDKRLGAFLNECAWPKKTDSYLQSSIGFGLNNWQPVLQFGWNEVQCCARDEAKMHSANWPVMPKSHPRIFFVRDDGQVEKKGEVGSGKLEV